MQIKPFNFYFFGDLKTWKEKLFIFNNFTKSIWHHR